jgi:hypothetical protein
MTRNVQLFEGRVVVTRKPSYLLVGVALVIAALGCGLVDDVRDVVESVDEAVALLEEIEESGTWEYVGNGLDGLENESYVAVTMLQEGSVTAEGGFTGDLSQDVTITLQVDDQGDAVAEVLVDGETREFLVDAAGEDQTHVYRIAAGRYRCVSNDDEGRLLRDGVSGAFEEYALEAAGVQLLSTAEEVGEETIAGRTVTHYELESKVPEAIEILKKFDNDDLQAKINEAGQFELSGDLYIDKETDALLRFDSVYHNSDTQRRLEFTFEVTQWGGVADIPDPAAELIDEACSAE